MNIAVALLVFALLTGMIGCIKALSRAFFLGGLSDWPHRVLLAVSVAAFTLSALIWGAA